MAESVPVPFQIDETTGRRYLTLEQIMADRAIGEFIKRFPDSFEWSATSNIAFFVESNAWVHKQLDKISISVSSLTIEKHDARLE